MRNAYWDLELHGAHATTLRGREGFVVWAAVANSNDFDLELRVEKPRYRDTASSTTMIPSFRNLAMRRCVLCCCVITTRLEQGLAIASRLRTTSLVRAAERRLCHAFQSSKDSTEMATRGTADMTRVVNVTVWKH